MTPPRDGGRSSDVAAIVLAGGRSRRFGRDKLVEDVDGVRMLDRATDSVRNLAAEIIVVVAATGGPAAPGGVTVVRDTEPDAGPLAGLVAGLAATRANRIIVVGGDMPFLVETVLAALLATLRDPAVEVAALEHDGLPRPLPIAVRRDPALRAAQASLGAGDHRLRAILEALSTTVIPETTWRALDPTARTLADVDTPADLDLDMDQ
jgi:molybdopterin-guanine dinucleotide biosynthesis protein A